MAGFIDNLTKVNAVAGRSPGHVWRFSGAALSVVDGVGFQGLAGDPALAISLSVWQTVQPLWHFVNKTVHGGPDDVLWSHRLDTPPDSSEGWDRLQLPADQGATAQAFECAGAGVHRQHRAPGLRG